jgi:hypothetical protein
MQKTVITSKTDIPKKWHFATLTLACPHKPFLKSAEPDAS